MHYSVKRVPLSSFAADGKEAFGAEKGAVLGLALLDVQVRGFTTHPIKSMAPVLISRIRKINGRSILS